MIDIRTRPHLVDVALRAAAVLHPPRQPHPQLVVVDAQTFASLAQRPAAVVIDGVTYVGVVPVDVVVSSPPPRPKPPQAAPVVPLEVLKARRSADLVAECDAAVEVAYPGRELTMLMADSGEAALLPDDAIARAVAASPRAAQVFWGLGVARAWVKAVRRIGAAAEDAVAAAKDADAVAAITVGDTLAALGPAPVLRGRDTLAALDAAEPR